MRSLLLPGALFATLAAAAPQDSRVPGGIAVLSFPGLPKTEVQALYQGKPVFIDEDRSGARRFIVGIPLAATPGAAGVLVVNARTGESLDVVAFAIQDKKYPEQHITLPADSKHVSPGAEELARYGREAAEQQAVYRIFSEGGKPWPDFIMPTPGEANASFGRKRFFNGEARAPHLGMDIAAPEGQVIVAPAEGVVAQTGDYFFNGRTVMIDHGQGLVSMLCHMQEIRVKAGDKLKQGDIVGLVGKTGRATGPHLHWTVSLNDARIDPLLVLPASAQP
ncbi:MAG: peptidase family protein [Moraxellaceae bacterium]|nr:peptidase family protein [Moraxellaceae bacterium]